MESCLADRTWPQLRYYQGVPPTTSNVDGTRKSELSSVRRNRPIGVPRVGRGRPILAGIKKSLYFESGAYEGGVVGCG